MKYFSFSLLGIVLISGCTPSQDYVDAAERYIQENCKGVVVNKFFKTVDGTINSLFAWQCAEEGGVKQYELKYKDIPGKFWKENEEEL